jgi:uncharacterized membrane protein YfcA
MPDNLLALWHAGAPELLIVAATAALAGFVDALVGGGGLVLVPALFAVFPNALPLHALHARAAYDAFLRA